MTDEKDRVLAKIELAYDRTLIMPVEEAMDFFKAIANGELLKKNYKNGDKILPVDEEIHMSLISAQKVRELKMNQILEPKDDD